MTISRTPSSDHLLLIMNSLINEELDECKKMIEDNEISLSWSEAKEVFDHLISLGAERKYEPLFISFLEQYPAFCIDIVKISVLKNDSPPFDWLIENRLWNIIHYLLVNAMSDLKTGIVGFGDHAVILLGRAIIRSSNSIKGSQLQAQVIELLLKDGVNPNEKINKNKKETSFLRLAVQREVPEVVALLLKYKASYANQCDDEGKPLTSNDIFKQGLKICSEQIKRAKEEGLLTSTTNSTASVRRKPLPPPLSLYDTSITSSSSYIFSTLSTASGQHPSALVETIVFQYSNLDVNSQCGLPSAFHPDNLRPVFVSHLDSKGQRLDRDELDIRIRSILDQ